MKRIAPVLLFVFIVLRLPAEDLKMKTLWTNKCGFGTVTALTFSPDGKKLASGGSDCVARIWDVENGTELFTFESQESTIGSLAFSPAADYYACGTSKVEITVRRIEK